MTVSGQNARFCFNNWLDSGAFTVSSSQPNYPASNLYAALRGKLWKAALIFEVSAQENKIHINGETLSITPGTYSKAALLSEINSKIAAIPALAGITCQSVDTGHFIFIKASTFTLNLSNQSQAAWDILGYYGTTDRSGLQLRADEERHTTGEWLHIDLKLPQKCDFAALIPEANSIFKMRTSRIRLQGNNLNSWVNPPVDLDFEVGDEGAFIAPDNAQPCRFWRVFIDDKTCNTIEAAVGYLGSAVIPTNTNIATGFTRTREDLSQKLVSEAGVFYVNRRPKQLSLSSVSIQFLKDSELEEIEQLFYDLGIEKPFFLCIDPRKGVSLRLAQMTHYVSVTSPLQLQHVLRGYYNMTCELREVL